jgi:FKBP-type peptidyl-prolyl cis-trans isomerase (trigger factor)
MAQRAGIEPDALDDAWVKANVEGVDTVAQLRDALRSQLADMNSHYVEQSKPSLCAAELAKRLAQAVPEAEVAHTRDMLEKSLEMDLSQQGATLDDMLATTGMDRTALAAMLDREAHDTAEQQAALGAYAEEKKLTVDDEELPGLLGMSPADAAKLIHDAKDHGQMEALREAALREKASRVAVAECACAYDHETPEEAAKRIAQYEQLDAMQRAAAAAKDETPKGDDHDDAGSGSDFKLV